MRDPRPSIALYELLEEIGASSDLRGSVSALDLRLRRVLPYNVMAVFLPAANGLIPAYVSAEPGPTGLEMVKQVVETRRPAFSRSMLAVPLDDDAGFVGVLTLYSSQPEVFEAVDLGVLLWIRAEMAQIVRRALAARDFAEELARMAEAIQEASEAAVKQTA